MTATLHRRPRGRVLEHVKGERTKREHAKDAPAESRARARHGGGGAGTDSRIRARQVAVARAAGRRRLRIVAGLFAFLALVALFLLVLHSPFLAARSVRIDGARHTTRAEVLSVTGLARKPPLVDVSAAADESALDRLPWVERATVVREWPSAVRVVLVERHAVAEVAAGTGRFALVDPSGRVLEDTTVRVAGFALVTGDGHVPPPGGAVQRGQKPAVDVAGAVPISLLARVVSVASVGSSGVVLRLLRGPRVLFGSPTELRQKMVALATVLARVPLTGIVTIDLRVPASPVLTS
jgi:cell division protein FtsQ